jgi:hypothetical protein
MMVGGQITVPASLPREIKPVPIIQEADWTSRPVCTDAESFSLPGFDHRTVQLVVSRTNRPISALIFRYCLYFWWGNLQTPAVLNLRFQ